MKIIPDDTRGTMRFLALAILLALVAFASLVAMDDAQRPIIPPANIQHPGRLPGMSLVGAVKVHVRCDICGGYDLYESPFAVNVVSHGIIFRDDKGRERAICFRCLVNVVDKIHKGRLS